MSDSVDEVKIVRKTEETAEIPADISEIGDVGEVVAKVEDNNGEFVEQMNEEDMSDAAAQELTEEHGDAEDADEGVDADEDHAGDENADDDLSEIDEDVDEDEQILSMGRHKRVASDDDEAEQPVKKLVTRRAQHSDTPSNGAAAESYTIPEDNTPFSADTRKREALEKSMAAALKSNTTRRKKNNDIDLEQMQDAQIQALKNQMQQVAYEDAKCINERSGVAMNKLKLLPKVKEVLMRKNLADSVLDNNLLESVRVWLEPLPDGSLPAYEIQKVMFTSLEELPIKTIHLRESGLGKVVLFYQKSKRVEPSLKRIADKLVGNWTRPILNLSDNYRDKHVQTEDIDIGKLLAAKKRKKQRGPEEPKTVYEEQAEKRQRAALPAARTTAYRIAPKVNFTSNDMSQASRTQAAGIGGSLSNSDHYRRISNKLQNRGKKVGAKKVGVSIEGRNLHI